MTDLAELRRFLRNEDPRASAAIESVMTFEQQDWITVFRDENSDDGGDLRIACLLRLEGIENALHQPGFDFSPGDGRPGFVGHSNEAGGWDIEYLTVGDEAVVPLVFDRNFSGPFPNVVELSEDFRLFWDLYEDSENRRL